MAGVKRAPSSLVHETISIGFSVAMPRIVQCAHQFQPGQHAVDAVEAAAFGLRVEVAADQHRRGFGIGAGAPREQVAHRIDADRHAGLAAPLRETLAPTPILVGERQAPYAAARGRADFRHLRQAAPEARAVHLHLPVHSFS